MRQIITRKNKRNDLKRIANTIQETLHNDLHELTLDFLRLRIIVAYGMFWAKILACFRYAGRDVIHLG